ncbi:hypothetical protein BHQ19_18370 [Mycolicibacterium porcinum]|nr:hypothetical protein BHQ19_18370 [Mycolicibacterium porcinum]
MFEKIARDTESERLEGWTLTVAADLVDQMAKQTAALVDRPVPLARDEFEARTLGDLSTPELIAIREIFGNALLAGNPDVDVARWCQELLVLITDEQLERGYMEAVERANRAAQVAEDKRMFNEMLPRAERDLSDLPPWSEASGS